MWALAESDTTIIKKIIKKFNGDILEYGGNQLELKTTWLYSRTTDSGAYLSINEQDSLQYWVAKSQTTAIGGSNGNFWALFS